MLYFVSAVLLVLSRLEHDTVQAARDLFAKYSTPVLEAVSLPVAHGRRAWDRASEYVDGLAQLDRLRAENNELRQWEWRAKRLERRLAHLRTLLNGVEEPALQFATGRVIADARGPFVRSVMVNLGKTHGVKLGYAVINGDGLVGRTVDVGDKASRVIMLNDLNSRIPVLVGPTGVRAILVGDNGPEPRLEFLWNTENIYEKDEVYTSGHGGLLPRGLKVGLVKLGPGKGFKVRPFVRLGRLEYVSVLFFDSPVILSREVSEAETLAPPSRAMHAHVRNNPAAKVR